MIFCNPHNPVGKCFNKNELIKVASLAKKYNVLVISDEVHCEIMTNGGKYRALLSV